MGERSPRDMGRTERKPHYFAFEVNIDPTTTYDKVYEVARQFKFGGMTFTHHSILLESSTGDSDPIKLDAFPDKHLTRAIPDMCRFSLGLMYFYNPTPMEVFDNGFTKELKFEFDSPKALNFKNIVLFVQEVGATHYAPFAHRGGRSGDNCSTFTKKFLNRLQQYDNGQWPRYPQV